MGENEQSKWGRALSGSLLERWPKNESGEPEEPVFLCHCRNTNFSDELKVNMLEAYGIACLRVFPGDGIFGSLVLGVSGQGVDLYVPASLYDDAKKLCEEESSDEL